MRRRSLHPDPRRRLSEMLGRWGLGWVLLGCAASLGAAGCGLCGGQTGDCSSDPAASGAWPTGGSSGSQAGDICDVARALTLDELSEDGFTARTVISEFAGTYTGTLAADANGAAGAGNPTGDADASRATSSVEDAGVVDAGDVADTADAAFWASVGLEAPAEPAEVLVTVSYQNGALMETSCSHQIQVEVKVQLSAGPLKEPPVSAWLNGSPSGAWLATTFPATSDPDVPALSLQLGFDGASASGTLRSADTDAAAPALELLLTQQQ